MKLICVDKNFKPQSSATAAPVLFLKPETSIILNNLPFFYPDFSSDIRVHAEPVLKICKLGKNIQPKYAHTYYDEVAISIRFYAHDLLEHHRKHGLPWANAVAFDGSVTMSKFVPLNSISLSEMHYHLCINGKELQHFGTKEMLFTFDEIIACVSQYYTIKTGDLVFTGISDNALPVKINDVLDVFMNEEKLLSCKVK